MLWVKITCNLQERIIYEVLFNTIYGTCFLRVSYQIVAKSILKYCNLILLNTEFWPFVHTVTHTVEQ